jgi:MFS family permease
MRNAIKILLFADAWCGFALGMIGPIYAIFVEGIGGSILDASWAYFAFMVSQGLALFALGHAEDRTIRRERYVTGGYALIALSCLMYLVVYDQTTLVITQVVAGLGGAVLSPAFDSLYGEHVDKKHEASEWGYWEGMGYLVTAAGAITGGYIAHLYGFRTLFLYMFAVSFVSVLVSLNLWRGEKYLANH